MSSKLAKEFPRIQNPNEQEVMTLKYMSTGNVVIHAPNVPPNVVMKILVNTAVDLLFTAFQQQEQSPIAQPPAGLKI